MDRIDGWRCWYAFPGLSEVLHSPLRPAAVRHLPIATWPKRTKHAECAILANPTLARKRWHKAPEENCACGIGVIGTYSDLLQRLTLLQGWAERRPPERYLFNTTPVIVVGRVTGSGLILGPRQEQNTDVPEFRVERARIQALWIPTTVPASDALVSLSESFATRYRVPVGLGLPDVRVGL